MTDSCSYLELGLKQHLSGDQEFKYCMNPDCNSGQYVSPDDEDSQFVCDVCEAVFCMQHDPMVKHSDESCEEYTERKEQEDATRKLESDSRGEAASRTEIERIAMACPGCQVRIQKSAGCDHMTCKTHLLTMVQTC